jgi:group I intron endonuclease
MSVAGVYQITCLSNNRIYIGSSTNIDARKKQHFSSLKHGKHENQHLQAAYNKYGKDNFVFRVLLITDKDLCGLFEKKLIDKIKPEFNINYYVGERLIMSQETKDKLSARAKITNLGRVVSEETRAKISAAEKGKPGIYYPHPNKYVTSEETKKKLSAAHKPHPVKEETKEKIRSFQRKRWAFIKITNEIMNK